MTKLILIRHGQSIANIENRFAGNYDAPLSELGVCQAKKSAEYIAEHYQVSKVYASDLRRAFATGKAVSDLLGVEIISDVRLREIQAGAWEGLEFVKIIEAYRDDFDIWLHDIGHAKATDGERVSELGERVFGAVTEIARQNEGKTVVIASHATPIRAVECMVRYGNLERMRDIPWVSNASITELVYENGHFECRLISYDEHLGELKSKLPVDV